MEMKWIMIAVMAIPLSVALLSFAPADPLCSKTVIQNTNLLEYTETITTYICEGN